jgi:hypothetical protein
MGWCGCWDEPMLCWTSAAFDVVGRVPPLCPGPGLGDRRVERKAILGGMLPLGAGGRCAGVRGRHSRVLVSNWSATEAPPGSGSGGRKTASGAPAGVGVGSENAGRCRTVMVLDRAYVSQPIVRDCDHDAAASAVRDRSSTILECMVYEGPSRGKDIPESDAARAGPCGLELRSSI